MSWDKLKKDLIADYNWKNGVNGELICWANDTVYYSLTFGHGLKSDKIRIAEKSVLDDGELVLFMGILIQRYRRTMEFVKICCQVGIPGH